MSTSESTPFLTTTDPSLRGPGPIHLPLDHGDTPTKRYLLPRIGHWINLVLAPVVAGLALTTEIKLQGRPRYYSYPWFISATICWVVVCSVVTILWSAGNLLRFRYSKSLLPSLFGLIIHPYIGIYLTVTAISAIINLVRFTGRNQCVEHRWPEPKLPADPGCLQWARQFEAWVWAYLACLALFASVHLVLAGTYLVYAYKSIAAAWRQRADRQGGGWEGIIPAGVFEMELKFRVGRPEPAVTQ